MTKDLLQFANSLTNYENFVEGILTDLNYSEKGNQFSPNGTRNTITMSQTSAEPAPNPPIIGQKEKLPLEQNCATNIYSAMYLATLLTPPNLYRGRTTLHFSQNQKTE